MTIKDALLQQYGFLYRTVRANLEGFTQEESLAQPQPGGNCANWILGHLTGAQNNVLGLLGEGPILEHPNIPLGGAQAAITGPENALPFVEMLEAFLASEERCLSALSAQTDESLSEGGFTDPFGGEATRGQLLNLLAFHQGYHAGQLGLSRRLVGKPGAIGAPEPSLSA
ncbi:MAG TPA: DinB family protein [Longimicrobiales bacterium]|nr:DinB family protein [Longimicrobiales bacterium]